MNLINYAGRPRMKIAMRSSFDAEMPLRTDLLIKEPCNYFMGESSQKFHYYKNHEIGQYVLMNHFLKYSITALSNFIKSNDSLKKSSIYLYLFFNVNTSHFYYFIEILPETKKKLCLITCSDFCLFNFGWIFIVLLNFGFCMCACVLSWFSHCLWLFETLWTASLPAPLAMGILPGKITSGYCASSKSSDEG